jgi:uncharacterized protein YndB with AHSA1/START domain
MAVHHATLVIERRFEAPPRRVYAAWAEPAIRARWDYPGDGWEAIQEESEFRIGGRKVSRFGPPGDPIYREDLHYADIVPDERIIFAYTMSRGAAPISSSLTTVELRPDGARTHMRLTEQAAFLDGGDGASDRERGWGEALDKLDAELRRQAQTA